MAKFKKLRKLLAFLLVFTMAASMLNLTVFAEGEEMVTVYLYLDINAPYGVLPPNSQGWFTLGKIEVPASYFTGVDLNKLPDIGYNDDRNHPEAFSSVSGYVSGNSEKINRYSGNASTRIDYNSIEWTDLKWCFNATSYDGLFEKGNCWHLNGKLNVSKRVVTVTINYVYGDGDNEGEKIESIDPNPYKKDYNVSEQFSVTSPKVDGYVIETGKEVVSGKALTDITEIVHYYKDSNNNGKADKDEPRYKVSYKVSGDIPDGYTEPSGKQRLIEGDTYTVEPVPENITNTEGNTTTTYTFDGWYEDASYTTKVGNNEKVMPAKDVTYYGLWTKTEETKVPELVIKKEASTPEKVYPGDFVSFTITVENIGNADATGVVIEDNLPKELINFIGTATEWKGLTIPAGETWTTTIYGIMVSPDAKAGIITNTATVTCAEIEEQKAEATITVDAKDTTTDPAPVPTENVTVTITKEVKNLGKTEAPADDTFEFHIFGKVIENGKLEELNKDTVYTVKAGEEITIEVAKGTTITILETEKEGYQSQGDVRKIVDKDNMVIPIVNYYNGPELTITKTVNHHEVELGEMVNFTITVTNIGGSTAHNVVVNDKLPDGLAQIGGKKDFSWTVGDLKAGESREFTINHVLVSDSATNTATAECDGIPDEISAQTTVTVKEQKTYTLTVKKEVTGEDAPDAEFRFRVAINGIEHVYEEKLHANGSFKVKGLRTGDTVQIEEIATPEGFTPDLKEKTVTITDHDESITITNSYVKPEEKPDPGEHIPEDPKYTYTLKYKLNGGTVFPALRDEEVTTSNPYYKFTVSGPAPYKKDLVFAGWLCESNGSIYQPGDPITASVINGTNNLVLVAQWKEVKTYTLTVEKKVEGEDAPNVEFRFRVAINGIEHVYEERIRAGESFKVEDLKLNDVVEIRELPTEGFTVQGGDTRKVTITGEVDDIVFTNVYKKPNPNPGTGGDEHIPTFTATYTLTYEDNVEEEVILVPLKRTVTSDKASQEFTVSSMKPERTGYVFLGWSENPNAKAADIQPGEKIYAATGMKNDIILYAIWAKDENRNGIDDSTEEFTLTVTKRVSGIGADPKQDFTFKVTVNGEEYSTETLKDTKNFTIDKLKFGDIVIVEETDIPAGYTPDNATRTVTIKKNTDLTIINYYEQEHIPEDPSYTFTLTYDPNGGSFLYSFGTYKTYTGKELTHTFTVDKGLKPTWSGYVFMGWAVSADDKTPVDSITAAVGNRNRQVFAIWEEDKNNNGEPDIGDPKYTVTYTDGVEDKEVFEDQVHENILSGTDTPAFKGTPTREGYVFKGWNPEVAEKVEGDATYTAQWAEDKNGDGTDDSEEKKYTVTYTDGANGEAFEDQVYPNILSGTDTPAFDGTPTREGYTFNGWNPVVAETVTEDATYVAQWEKIPTEPEPGPGPGTDPTEPDPEEPTVYSFVLRYDANAFGVLNMPEDETAESTETSHEFTVSSTIPTRDGFKFLGWSETPGNTSGLVEETVTATFGKTKAEQVEVVLYAIWEADEDKPTPDPDTPDPDTPDPDTPDPDTPDPDTPDPDTPDPDTPDPDTPDPDTPDPDTPDPDTPDPDTPDPDTPDPDTPDPDTPDPDTPDPDTPDPDTPDPDTPDPDTPDPDTPDPDTPDPDTPDPDTPDPDTPNPDDPNPNNPDDDPSNPDDNPDTPDTPDTPDNPDTPDEPDEPVIDIPDENPPLADEPTDEPTVDIPDEEPPLGELPDEDMTEIPDEEVPLDSLPETGDDLTVMVWFVLALASGLGLCVIGIASRKRRN